MTTYTATTDAELAPEVALTTTTLTKLRDNTLAIQENDPTAPDIVIPAGSVGQNEIKDSSGGVSSSAIIWTSFILPGGSHGLYPQIKMSAAESTAGYGASLLDPTPILNTLTTDRTLISLLSYSAVRTITATQRYFTASAPYNLGDGDIPRFTFILIDNASNRIDAVYSATEAPWHYNGKTDIRGKLGKDGKKYITRKDMSDVPFTFRQAIDSGDIAMVNDYNNAFSAAKNIDIEITQAIKNADMGDIPHPFTGNDLTGKTVVMLDPVCDLNHELAELSLHDEFSINELLHDGYITIGKDALPRTTPNGVIAVSPKWKSTK